MVDFALAVPYHQHAREWDDTTLPFVEAHPARTPGEVRRGLSVVTAFPLRYSGALAPGGLSALPRCIKREAAVRIARQVLISKCGPAAAGYKIQACLCDTRQSTGRPCSGSIAPWYRPHRTEAGALAYIRLMDGPQP